MLAEAYLAARVEDYVVLPIVGDLERQDHVQALSILLHRIPVLLVAVGMELLMINMQQLVDTALEEMVRPQEQVMVGWWK